MSNKLIIAAAGSGKSTFIVSESLKIKNEKVLITTYTESNEEELKRKFVSRCKSIPGNITIQTWFSFLIRHGVKPYQGTFNSILFNREVSGLLLNNGEYGIKYYASNKGKKVPVYFNENTEFEKHYFSVSGKIYSDRLAKFIVKANISSNGEIVSRISRIFKYIFIDEVQDLAGYDLEILKFLFQSSSNILLVGDPRQVTYLTHHEKKYGKYKNGMIKEFIRKECKKKIYCEIDEQTLNVSHRNNKAICEYSSKLYPADQFKVVEPCSCEECRKYTLDSEGVYLVKECDLNHYLRTFNPVQLRWNSMRKVNTQFPYYNFGESKGKTFQRVIIYPTLEMEKWVYNNNIKLSESTKAKFYVAVTRARFSVAIISNFHENAKLDNVQLYHPNIH